MVKICLTGCNGQMGSAVSQLAATSKDVSVVAGVDPVTSKRFAYPVYADLLEFGGHIDVLLDFSHAAALPGLLAFAEKRAVPIVLATTGYDEAALTLMQEAAARIPIFQSANMSLGISLLADLVRRACQVLGENFDVEIVERHHRRKLDAPSGTAKLLFDAAAEALPYEAIPVYDRHDVRAQRDTREIGLSAVRGGTIVGEHEVIFAGHHEVIELRHSATSREVFAAGALRAAQFMARQTEPGLYAMKDLLRAR